MHTSVGNRAMAQALQRKAEPRPSPGRPAAVPGDGASDASTRGGGEPLTTAEPTSATPGVPGAGPNSTPGASSAAATGAGPGGNASPLVPGTGTQAGQGPGLSALASAGAAIGGFGGPFSFLELLGTAVPSQIGARLGQSEAALPAAMEQQHAVLNAQLPAQAPPGSPAPTDPVTLPTPAAVSTPTVAPQATSAVGAPDPTVADRAAEAGAASIAATATAASLEQPNVAALVKPTTAPAPLPGVALAGPGPVTTSPSTQKTEAEADEARMLDASMGEHVRTKVSAALVPARAAAAASDAESTKVRVGAVDGVRNAESAASNQHVATLAAGQAEVDGMRQGWVSEKASIVATHEGALRSDASAVRAQAAETVADAEARAKEQASKDHKGKEEGAQDTGLWDRVRSVGSAVARGVTGIANSITSSVRAIVDTARQKVNGLVDGLVKAMRARVAFLAKMLTERMRTLSAAMADALKKAQQLANRIVVALSAFVSKIWKAAGDLLNQLWQKLQAAIARAVAAAKAVVQAVAKALGTVRAIIKLLGNKLVQFLAAAAKDPQGKIVNPIVALAAPLAPGVPARAESIAKQEGAATAKASAPAPASGVHRSIQRTPAPGPAGEGFWDGVWRHVKGAGAEFAEHWALTLGKVILGILAWVPMLIEELPALWGEVKGAWSPAPGGPDRLDHILGVVRHIVNIVAGTIATIGVWALIIGLCFPPAEPFIGAGYEAISLAVLAADVAIATAQMGKAAYSATRPGIDTPRREQYLGMFAGAAIGAAVTGVMLLLGAIAARLAKVFRATRVGGGEGVKAGLTKGIADGAAEGSAAETKPTGPGKGEPIGDPTEVRTGNPNLDPRLREYPYQNPPNMRVVPPGTPLDLGSLNPKVKYIWVVDGEGNFKFAPETQNSSNFMKPLPKDKAFPIKHGDLVPGENGLCRGPARAGGELRALTDIDGNPSGMWELNNDSSYTFARVDAAGNPLPWAPAESIEAVRNHLVAGGTPPNKLVTTDVIAPERLKGKK